MFMAIVSAAAPTPLPDPGPAGNAPAAGDETQFDATLTATLQGSQRVQGDAVARADEEPSKFFADPLALAERLLVGTPVQKDEAAAVAATPDEEANEDEDAKPSKVKGDALWEIPADGLLAFAAPAPQPVQPQPAVGVSGDVVVTVTPALDGPMTDAPAANAAVSSTQSAGAQGVAPQATAEQRQQPVETPVDAPAGADVAAAAQQAATQSTSADKAAQSAKPAAAPAGQKPSRTHGRWKDATTKAAEPQTPETKAEFAAKPAEVSAEQRAEEAAPAAGTRVRVNAAQTPQVKVQTPVQMSAEQASSAKVEVSVTSGMTPASQPDAREMPAPAARQTFSAAVSQLQPQMSNGGDAQAFAGESDGRRSAAAARLAAALSMGAADKTDAGAPAPVFSVPAAAAAAQPASFSPVVAAAPVVETTPDAENINRLVEAMRVTAKAGGWEATVRLKPHHLGEVSIALRVDGSNVSAVVNAEAAGVRQWLLSQENAVRSGMAEHGLHLESFQVTRDGQRRDAQGQEPEPERRRQPQRRTANGAAERFEIVV
jgi:flagellar hook-length control protein FliK